MKFVVLTIFPEAFKGILDFSILKRAAEKGKAEFELVNIRDFAPDKHKMTDDTPYGGGEGMVMKVEPLHRALESSAGKEDAKTRRILLSASGKKLTQEKLKEYSELDRLVLVCGRYEGFDERVLEYVDEEISTGDYVLSGGEIPALAVIEGTVRLLPGVLGNENSTLNESFSTGILDFPQYTKPGEYEGKKVPEELLSGNHKLIKEYRRKEALKKTLKNRPELLENIELSGQDKKLLKGIKEGEN
ncbi:MAG TPA: tRNA (guanosine(37)-N1)-methyltransferase TrmD [bacterium]|nr:tRNA (guanosine(37)-N1)-methyltransferase TrmD [bacterium]